MGSVTEIYLGRQLRSEKYLGRQLRSENSWEGNGEVLGR